MKGETSRKRKGTSPLPYLDSEVSSSNPYEKEPAAEPEIAREEKKLRKVRLR